MSNLHAALRRIVALSRKEAKQIRRDPSSIAIGIIFPVIMIFLFGYGLSLDVNHVAVAVVDEESSADSVALIGDFQMSRYFDVTVVHAVSEAKALMQSRKIDGVVLIPPDFTRRAQTHKAEIEILVNGTESNQARIMQAYAEGPVALWNATQGFAGPVVLRDHMWFNEGNDSHFFLVPGLIVLVMTVIGAFLTAMVVSREWERGTIEALFVTPMQPGEFLISKFIPYFVLGMIGFLLCLLAGQFLFRVPLRGSLLLLFLAATLYLLVALSIGLLVSTRVKSQFLASQITLLLTFLPAMMLSGFLYDLRSMPALIRGITYILPARYAVALMQTLYLAGDVPGVLWLNFGVLAAMAAVLILLTRLSTRKSLS